MTGHEPDMLGWLWSQNNEHRLPLPRLIYWILLEITGDFRSGMVLNVVLLSLLAIAMAGAARAMRGGRSSYADVIFPIVLLHLGNWANLMWGWQLQFVCSTALAGLLLAVVVAKPGPVEPRAGLVAAACLVLLPLSGANGLIVAAPMALWLAAHGVVHFRNPGDGTSRRLGIALLVAAGLSLTLIGVYFIGYAPQPGSPARPNLGQFISTAAMFVAYAFGPAALAAWVAWLLPVSLSSALVGCWQPGTR